MALENEQLFGASVAGARSPIRMAPSPDGVQPKRYAAVAGAPTLALGLPVVKDGTSGFWRSWVDADAIPHGFVYPSPAKMSATGETIHSTLVHGTIHASDVVLPAGQTLATLQAALKNIELRKLGFDVQGLTGVA